MPSNGCSPLSIPIACHYNENCECPACHRLGLHQRSHISFVVLSTTQCSAHGHCERLLASRLVSWNQHGRVDIAADCRAKHAEENPPFWYSFEHGLIHFVMLSSEHSVRRHSKQWKWLVAHLNSIDRCKTPWVVVGFHRPLYAIHPHRANRVVRRLHPPRLPERACRYTVVRSMYVTLCSASKPCNCCTLSQLRGCSCKLGAGLEGAVTRISRICKSAKSRVC